MSSTKFPPSPIKLQPRNIFVYIIESPSPKDFFEDVHEGEIISKTLTLAGVKNECRRVVNRNFFKMALLDFFSKSVGAIPILHISAHGDKNGFQLTNEADQGQILEWSFLTDFFQAINDVQSGQLLLCMSSCEGFSACKMAMKKESVTHPFFGVIGNRRKPTYSDTLIGFSTFYHLFKKGASVVDAVNAMKYASGNFDFDCITAAEAQNRYIKVLETNEREKIQKIINAMAKF